MRIAVFTTSYPRSADDYAGRFVADAVERLRSRGLQVQVVSPGVYSDFGLSAPGGGGLVRNVKRRPWKAPLMLFSMIFTLRRVAREADLVHAHWLAGALIARFAGKPLVVTLHGSGSAGSLSDAKLARKMPWLIRWLLKPARAVICVSWQLAAEIERVGVKTVVIPNAVEIPNKIPPASEGQSVLYVGRLSPEKEIEVLLAATEGLSLVVAGDGPLRHQVPAALGFVPHSELGKLYSDAAVVVAPCRSEGFGIAAAEAMAHARPVVAARAGGLLDLVVHGETGLLVEPGDAAAFRAAIVDLLGSPETRARMGAAAQERARSLFGWDNAIEKTIETYRRAAGTEGER